MNLTRFSGLFTVLFALSAMPAVGAVTVSPHGVAVAVEDEAQEVALILSNASDREAAFEVKFDEPEGALRANRIGPLQGWTAFNAGRRGGPRGIRGDDAIPIRDDVEDLRVIIFTDGNGWGGRDAAREGAIAAGVPQNQISQVGSGQAGNADLEEFDVVIWVDAHGNDYYQQYNRNRARFEEWVDAGGILISAPADGALNPVLVLPGGVERDNGNTDAANVRQNGADQENPILEGDPETDEDDFPERITGSSCSHQAFLRGEFQDNDDIENPQIFYVTEGNRDRVTIATYEFGRGNVLATTLTESAHWYWWNQGGAWMQQGPRWMVRNQILWAAWVAGPKWLTVEPEEGAVEANGETELTMTFNPEGIEDGVYELYVVFELDDEEQPSLMMSAVMSVNSPVAQLTGQVTDAENDAPLEGAEMSVQGHYYKRYADEEGVYAAENVPLGAYTVTFSATDYLPLTREIELDEEGEAELNVALLHADCELDPDNIITGLEPDQRIDIDITLDNPGNGPLTYTTTRELLGDANADPWELRRANNFGQVVNDTRLEGVEFFNDHYYVSGAHGGQPVIYIFNRDGENVGNIRQPGEDNRGFRDIAWDGALIWGSIGRRIYGIDLDGEVQAEFDSPYNPTTSIAWDAEGERLWVAGTTTNISALNRQGERQLELNRRGLRMYGLSWFPEDPDQHPLYVYHREPNTDRQVLHKFNMNADTLRVNYLEPPAGGVPGGATITNRFDVYSWVFMCIANQNPDAGGDRVDIWQIDARKDWMRIAPDRGVVEAGGQENMTLTLNAAGLPTVRFQGRIVFKHDGVGAETILPITVDVVEGRVQTQRTLRFDMGWTMASLNLNPNEPAVPAMFEPLVQEGVLLMVKDGQGRFFMPERDFNNIPGWAAPEGYWVKVSSPGQLVIRGESVLMDDPLELEQGWQIISYYPRVPVDAPVALSRVRDALEIVKDDRGNFFVPRFNFSNMAPMREGKGYAIKLTEAAELVYSLREGQAAGEEIVQGRSPYERPGRLPSVTPTGENMSLLVIGGMASGELAVYCGALRVGGGVVENGLCGIAVWGDDPTTPQTDGATKGSDLSLRLVTSAGELPVTAKTVEGEGVYQADGFWAIQIENASVQPSEFGLQSAYPNPFNNRTRVAFSLLEAGSAELALFDVNGRAVWRRSFDQLAAGGHNAVVNGESLAAGVYLMQLNSGGGRSVMKLALVK